MNVRSPGRRKPSTSVPSAAPSAASASDVVVKPGRPAGRGGERDRRSVDRRAERPRRIAVAAGVGRIGDRDPGDRRGAIAEPQHDAAGERDRSAERSARLAGIVRQHHAGQRREVPGGGRERDRRVSVLLGRDRHAVDVGDGDAGRIRRREEVHPERHRADEAGRRAGLELRGQPPDRPAGTHGSRALGSQLVASPSLELAGEDLRDRHLALHGDREGVRDVLPVLRIVELVDQQLRPADQADTLNLRGGEVRGGSRQAPRHVCTLARELDADLRELQARALDAPERAEQQTRAARLRCDRALTASRRRSILPRPGWRSPRCRRSRRSPRTIRRSADTSMQLPLSREDNVPGSCPFFPLKSIRMRSAAIGVGAASADAGPAPQSAGSTMAMPSARRRRIAIARTYAPVRAWSIRAGALVWSQACHPSSVHE